MAVFRKSHRWRQSVHRSGQFRTVVVGIAAVSLTAGALAGCSGASSKSDDGTVTVALIAPLTGAKGVYDPFKNAVVAAVDAINAEGGAGGHKIKLSICDAQESANTASACGVRAVQEKAVAAITMVAGETPYEPYLRKAGIPTLGLMVDPIMRTSEISYSTGTPGGASNYGVIALAKREGCKQLVYVRADPAAPAQAERFQEDFVDQAESVGLPASFVSAAPGSADMSPYIARALATGTDCMMVGAYGADAVPLLTEAVDADPDERVKLYTCSCFLTAVVAESLGADITDRFEGVDFTWSSSEAAQSEHPGIARFISELKKFAPEPFVLDSGNSKVAWSELHAVAAAIANVKGEVTAGSVASQLDKFHDYDPGIGPAVSFDTTPGDPVPPRVFAPYGIEVKWTNGVPETVGSFFNYYTGELLAE